jgi:hypothetical protein
MFNSAKQPQPSDHGYDWWLATQNNAGPSHENPKNFVRNGQPVGPTQGYSCQVVADESIKWLHEIRDQKKPFFQFVCFHEPHEPIASPPDLVAQYPDAKKEGEALYYANVTNMDRAVGKLLAYLDEANLAENTLVFFTSDNGPETLLRYPNGWRSHGSPGPLRGMKLHVYDGGIRVPGILRWPARVKAGQTSREPICNLDLLPTFCELAGIKPPQDPQWRNNRWGLYIQDNWKVTRKLTLDIGLRWDLLYEGHEIHNRSSQFGPNVVNPVAGGLLGGVMYEGYGAGRCNCEFTDRYPYAIGPRLGVAYQINSKTVFRAGWGVVYGNLRTYNNFTGSAIQGVGFDTKFFTTTNPGVQPAFELKDGFVYDRAALTVPSLNPGLINILSAPSYYIDRNGSRPPRINQWSIGLQREVVRNLVVEAAYVGSRTIWLVPSGTGNITSMNIPDPAYLKSRYGIDVNNAADRTLLTSRIDSALAAQRGFKAPYAGYPGSASVAQTIRPYPQFTGFGPSWAPLGNGWYDSLQAKLTKRYSHGLDMTAAFTWSKELATGQQAANDIFNRPNQKSLVDTSQPVILVLGINYELPKLTQSKLVRAIVGGWVTGGIFRYASGMPIAVPASTGLASYIFQNTRFNRVPGVPLYLKDLNCHCYDPNKELVLNPAAWTDALPGQFGVSAPYYGDYRYHRRPLENLIVGRTFHIREKTFLQVRGEMFNALNRLRMPNPDGSNPLATPVYSSQGVPTAGFGRINASSSTTGERTVQLVGRFQF